MNRHWIMAVTAGLVLSFAACSSPDSRNARNQGGGKAADSAPAVTVTGCLMQGSRSNEFVLQNAHSTSEPQRNDALTATSYAVVASSDKVDLAKQLNHQVEVKGRPQMTPYTRDTLVDKSVPTLIAIDVKSVADKCTAPSH